jgi:DNA-binding XRE family transcriptional regulator
MTRPNVVSVTATGPAWDWCDRMRKIRRDIAHMSQEQMAELLEMRAATYSAWEGGRAKPHRKLAERVALRIEERFAGQVSAAWVLGYRIGDPTPGPASYLHLIGEDDDLLPRMDSNHQPCGQRFDAGQAGSETRRVLSQGLRSSRCG